MVKRVEVTVGNKGYKNEVWFVRVHHDDSDYNPGSKNREQQYVQRDGSLAPTTKRANIVSKQRAIERATKYFPDAELVIIDS